MCIHQQSHVSFCMPRHMPSVQAESRHQRQIVYDAPTVASQHVRCATLQSPKHAARSISCLHPVLHFSTVARTVYDMNTYPERRSAGPVYYYCPCEHQTRLANPLPQSRSIHHNRRRLRPATGDYGKHKLAQCPTTISERNQNMTT